MEKHIVTQSREFSGNQSSKRESATAHTEITYGEVIRAARATRRSARLPDAKVINAANAWLRYLKKAKTDLVGGDFDTGFNKTRDAFLLQITPATRNNVFNKRVGLRILRDSYRDLVGAAPLPLVEGDVTYADVLEVIQSEPTTLPNRRAAIYLWLEHHDLLVQGAIGAEFFDEQAFKLNLEDVLDTSKIRIRSGNHKSRTYERRGALRAVRIIALALRDGKSPEEAVAVARKEQHGTARRQGNHQSQPKTPSRMPTYGQLRQDLSGAASSRNKLAALNDWLTFHTFTDKTAVGPEILDEKRLNDALDDITASIDKSGTRNNKISALRSLRQAALIRVPDLPKATLEEALREALKKIGIGVKKAIGRYGKTFQSWLYAGHAPTKKSEDLLARIATDAGLPADHFAPYIVLTQKRDRKAGVNEWAKTTRAKIEKPYALNRKATEPLPPNVQRWVDAYCLHKKVPDPAPLKRFKGKVRGLGQWMTNSKGCGTEKAFRQHVEEFFGFLRLPADAADPDLRGMGFASSDLTFPMFVDAGLVKAFFAFRKTRSKLDYYPKGALSLLQRHTPLVHPITGFITQQPQIFMPQLVGADRPATPEAFDAWCAQQLNDLLKFQSTIENNPSTRMARDPKKLLAPILERDQPLTFMRELIAKMERDRPPANAPEIWRAKHEADIALIALWTACPLRVYNMSIAEVDKQLRKRPDGWWFVEERHNFKNRVFREDHPIWEMRIADPFQPYIEDYISRWRPKLPGAKAGSSHVWVSHSEEDPNGLSEAALEERMRAITGTYMNMRLACHWIRHVVATDYILNQPGSFVVAAFVLNDSLSTVMGSYAHLMSRVMNQHYQNYLDQIFPSNVKRRSRSLAPSTPLIMGRP